MSALPLPRTALAILLIAAALAAMPRAVAAQAHADSAVRDSAAPPARAIADTLAGEAESLAVELPPAPVFLGGREIFVVRASRNGLSPAARAAAIRKRLDSAVADFAIPADSVSLRRSAVGVEVRFGPHFLWTITPGDVPGMTLPQLAAIVAALPDRIAGGITRERAGRSPLGMLIAIGIAIGITIVAWVLLRLLLAASRRWRAFLDRTLPRFLGGIRIGTFDVLSQGQVTGIVGGILARLDLVAGLLLLYGWLTAVFSLFPWSQGWSWSLLGFARMQLVAGLRSFGAAIPGLLVIVAIFILFRWITRLSDHFFEAIRDGSVEVGWVHRELAEPTKKLLRIVLWLVAAAIAWPFIPGSGSKAVQGLSILVGLMVSLGSTGIVGNLVAGIVLTYSRAFHAGERVKIGEHIGTVVGLGFFATKLRSLFNEEITLPNGQVASQPIVNFSRLAENAGLILHTQVTIGYDVDWRKVHALLIEAAGQVPGIDAEPAPTVYQRSLNDHHITYMLACFTRLPLQQIRLYSGLHEQIQDAFARAGVEILSPAYSSLRDANAPVLPKEPAGPRAEPGGFRVRSPGDA